MRRAAITLIFAVLLTAGSSAAAFDVSVEGRLKGQLERIGVSHDASPSNAMLGAPTSILEFAPTGTLWAELALSGRSFASTGLWFDVSVSVPLAGGGTFEDFDYYAGQNLFSHTLSGVSIGQGIIGHARLPVPFVGEVSGNNITLRPYIAGSVESRQLTATGLICGAICGAIPTVSKVTAVIGHGLSGWQAGAGLWLEAKLSDTQTLDVRAEVLGGNLSVNDTHFLRTNLGPAPHIAYSFTTLSAQAELTYTHALTNNLAVTASVSGGFSNGTGTAMFGASKPTPVGIFDANFWKTSGAAALGLKVSFQ